jgi:hypothetical protein
MKKNIIHKNLMAMIIAICIGFALPVFAQDESQAKREAREAIKERIMHRVLEVKHQKLREVLNLNDETSQKFFAQYDPAEKDMLELVKQKQEQELKLLQLTQGNYKDADVDPTLENIKSLDQKIRDRYEQLDNNLKPVLEPRQRAKLMVFEKEFNRIAREKVREKVKQWKDNHPGERPFKDKKGPKAVRPNGK